MIKGQDIICVTVSDWDEPKRSRHHLMSILAKDNRVLFVERPVSLFGLLRSGTEWKRLARFFKGIRHRQDQLFLFTPPPILPGGDWLSWINWLNQKIINFAVRRIAFKMGFIERKKFTSITDELADNEYKKYLLKVLKEADDAP